MGRKRARTLACRQPLIEELEARLLFSADAAVVVAPVEVPVADAGAHPEAIHLDEGPAGEGADPGRRRELVFVDAGVEGHESLVDDLRTRAGARQLEVVVLDSQRSGVEQIGEALSAHRGELDAVHVVSHGDDGAVLLGNDWLRSADLGRHAQAIAAWGAAFAADGDLLFYGCDLASGARGVSLVDSLAALTGVDVAASTDATGAARLGGDWILEHAVGEIDSELALSAEARAGFAGILASTSFQQGSGGYADTQDTQIDQTSPTTDRGSNTSISIDLDDGGGPTQGLVRFDGLFGTGPGQIPPGSTITSATLTFEVTDPSDGAATIALHRMLDPWDESFTWNDFGGGVQLDDNEAHSVADGTVPSPGGTGTRTVTGLDATVQAWLDGAANHGWVIVTDSTDGWDFRSSETGTVSQRPRLDVTYDPNSAPILTPFGPDLTPITEDDLDPGGDLVSSIVGASISDPDGHPEGIAITALTSGSGTWQYSLNGGGAWSDVGTVSDSSSLLLRSTDLVRFVPDGIDGESPDPTFGYRAWDRTIGTEGTKVDTSSNGDPTPFSTATDTASIAVSAVNDAPSLGDGSVAAVNEDDPDPPGDTVTSLFGAGFSDVDGTLAGVAIVGNAAPGAEGVWQYSSDGGLNWADVGSVTDGANALAIQNTSLLRFLPAADYNGTPTDLVLRGLDDSYAGAWSTTTGGTETRVDVDTSTTGGITPIAAATSALSTSVTPVNDAPSLGNASLAAVSEDETSPPGATVAGLLGAGFSDVDGSFAGVAIVGNAAPGAEGVWQYSSDGGLNWADVGSVTDGANALAIQNTSLLRFLPAADYNGTPTDLVLRGLDDSYAGAWSATTGGTETRVDVDTSTPGDPSAIAAATSTLSTSITPVNDAPTLGSGSLPAVNEDDSDPPGATGASLFGAGFSDVDGSFAGVAIVGNAAPGTEGVWQYSSDGGLNWADVGSVTDGATALAIQTTSLLRFLPAADYNGTPTDLVLRGLDDTYAGAWSTTTGGTETRVDVDTSTPGDPSAIAAATSTLSTSITSVNDAPSMGNGSLAAVLEDGTNPPGASVAALFGGGFADVDGSFSGVAIVGNAAPGAEGVWQYSNDGGANWAEVGAVADGATALAVQTTSLLRFLPAAEYNGTPTDLVLRGLDDTYAGAWSTTTGGTETRVNVDTSSPGDPSAITAATSTLSTSVTAQNDAPVLGTNSLTVAESGSVILGPADLSATDIDDSDPLLEFTVGAVTGGRFELVSAPGTPISSFFQGDVTSGQVRFLHDGGEAAPSYTVTVSDGGLTDGPSAASVTFSTVNDAPTLAGTTPLSFTDDKTPTTPFSTAVIDDVDLPGDVLTVEVRLDDAAKGALVGGFTPVGGGVYRFTGSAGAATIALQALSFVPAANRVGVGGSELTAFTISVDDGAAPPLSDSTTQVSTTSINDAPTLVDVSFSIPETASLGTVVGTLSATDVDPGETFTYSLLSPPGAFAVSAAGVVTVADPTLLDFETQPTWALSVQVVDASAAPATATVMVNLSDVNENLPLPDPPDPPVEEPPPEEDPVEEPEASTEPAAEVPGSTGGDARFHAALPVAPRPFERVASGSDAGGPALRRPDRGPESRLVATPPPTRLAAPLSIDGAMLRALDLMGVEISQHADATEQRLRMLTGAVEGAAAAATAGFLTWFLRSGTLLTSLLSSLPVWSRLDPLPVLVARDGAGLLTEDEDEDERRAREILEDTDSP